MYSYDDHPPTFKPQPGVMGENVLTPPNCT
jgi:hypothetical protein